MISLVVVSGFRYKSGTDFATYTENFQYLNMKKDTDTQTQGNAENQSQEGDIGFDILCQHLYKISTDPQIMFFATALITNVLIVLVLMKYSSRFELSIWLYITTFVYYSTFNGLRQWMAAAILFAGTKYLLKERSFIKYLPIALFASLFHKSALVMIPIYFFINSKTFSKRNLLMVLGFMFAVFAYSKFLPILANVLEGTQYAHYVQIFETDTNGINPLRLAVYFAPIGMACFFYKQFNPKKDIQVDRLLNLCIIGFFVMFMALRQVFFARLIFYFDLYYLLLIPRLIDIGDKPFKRFLYYSISVGYFAFSYLLLITGDAWILPYTFKITLF
ncbi:Transmembrane protein EpsG [bioreactor metagenome]|uniref:Transmembrane protein EpsG n=1 Tax=bioreactor metagenome TaxID=1076179 RepID=A0A645E8P5_9ZZZZ